MSQRHEKLSESARLLRARLRDLEKQQVSELQRPMHEVALLAVREELTRVGQTLRRLVY